MAGEMYFVRSRGKVTGPFDIGGLQRLAKLGMLSRVHEVSTDKRNWASAASVPGVLPENAASAAAGGRSGAGPTDAPSNTYEITQPPQSSDQPVTDNETAPWQPTFTGPMVACGSCGSVLPAAQLFNDRGRYICPSCYQRQVPGAPPTGQYPVNGEDSKGYHGYGVASLILGLTGLVIPFFGLVGAVLAIVFGAVGLRGNRRIGSREGSGMARSGLIMGIVSLSLYILWFIFYIIVVAMAAVAASAHGR